MYKTLSINMVNWLSYLESEDFMKNGINQMLEIYYRDHLRLVVHKTQPGTAPEAPIQLEQDCKMFSRREREVLLWMAEGLSSKMIAGKLNISEHTVINHRRSMQEKSHKPNATALVSFAIRNGII